MAWGERDCIDICCHARTSRFQRNRTCEARPECQGRMQGALLTRGLLNVVHDMLQKLFLATLFGDIIAVVEAIVGCCRAQCVSFTVGADGTEHGCPSSARRHIGSGSDELKKVKLKKVKKRGKVLKKTFF